MKDIFNMLFRLIMLTAVIVGIWAAYFMRDDLRGQYEALVSRFSDDAQITDKKVPMPSVLKPQISKPKIPAQTSQQKTVEPKTEPAPAASTPNGKDLKRKAWFSQPTEAQPENKPHQQKMMQLPVEPATIPLRPAPPAKETSVTASAAPKASTSTLTTARRAAWLGRYDEAISHYRTLAASEPENADVWGEMGNVYLSMGHWQQAAEAYYEAAITLGSGPQSMQLLRALQRLNPQLADKLNRQLVPAPQRQAPSKETRTESTS